MSIRSFTSLAVERDDMETDTFPYATLPLTRNVADADVLRTPRRPPRNLAHLLGITVACEDDMLGPETGADTDMLTRFGEAGQEGGSPQEQWRAPAAWSSYRPDDAPEIEEQPLLDKRHDNEGKGRRKGKTRQRLAGLNPFRRRKAAAAAAKSGSAPPSLSGRTAGMQNPFGDEHALAPSAARGRSGDPTAQDEQMDTHDGPGPSPDPTPCTPGHDVAFPSLAAAAHTSSAPSTPRQSPKSGSARSWLSEVSNSSGLSSASSLLRKNIRRRARLSAGADGSQPRMRSMRKTVQVLGPEAAGAVVRGTSVSPNKLRYMDFGRRARAYVKRRV